VKVTPDVKENTSKRDCDSESDDIFSKHKLTIKSPKLSFLKRHLGYNDIVSQLSVSLNNK